MDKKKLQSFKGGEAMKNSLLLTALSSLKIGGNMKRFLMFLLVVVLIVSVISGCTKDWDTEETNYRGPNWTSDNKVIFVREKITWHHWQGLFGAEGAEVKRVDIWLCEINNDGSNYREIEKIYESEDGGSYSPFNVSTSSAGEWVVIGWGSIYVVKRDGSQLEEVGSGRYPDFSPDASQIVYEKKDEGIWVMDRDGSGDHSIWADSANKKPSWSTDGGRIAFVRNEGWQDEDLWVMDTSGGNRSKVYDGITGLQPDWAPPDTNAILFCSTGSHTDVIYLDTNRIRELEGYFQVRWSPNGAYLTGTDEEGIFVMEVDGSNKIHIKP